MKYPLIALFMKGLRLWISLPLWIGLNIYLLTTAVMGQTVTSNNPDQGIIFLDLDASGSVNAAMDDSEDPPQQVEYGPWGCRFTLQPLDINCGREPLPVEVKDLTSEQMVILNFLKGKREELLMREREIAEKEQDIANLERRVEQKINTIKDLTDQIEEERARIIRQDTENLQKLVSYYEKMPSENAAIFFNQMDSQTATMILTRMNPRRVAAVMAELTPQKAASLTEDIANITANRQTLLNLPDFEQ